MPNKKINIKKISSAPIRYALYVDEVFQFSFDRLVYNEFCKDGESFNYDLSWINTIAKSAEKSLKNEMFNYLSKRETSPKKIQEWLSKRKIDVNLQEKYLQIALENNFFSPMRFVISFIEQKCLQAKYPWWVIKRELYHKLSKYRDNEEIKELIESKSYDDFELLMNNFFVKQQAKLNPDKIKKNLRNRGFSHLVIEKFFKEMESNESNEI